VQLLLDTHVLIWWWGGDSRLPKRVRTLLADPQTTAYVSAASALEMAIKVRIGRLPQMEKHVADFDKGVRGEGFYHLYVRDDHAIRAGLLSGEHRDPFDRTIAAQGLIESLPVVTRDPAFAAFGCQVVW
jgi:PIN domain nuclease of toxin-antitoxin system